MASGVSIETGGVGKPKKEYYLTPIEPKFAAEVNYASVGIKREHANEMVKELLAKYRDKIANPPLGMKYQECCEIKTGNPSSKCLATYHKVKEELKNLGLEFKY